MSFFGRSSRNYMTFRPRKSAPSGNKGLQLKKHIDATLGRGNLREAVRLPIGEDLNEWLAVNTVDFYNQVSVLYGTLIEFCTPANCPIMSAGSKYEYRWADGVNVKKPIEVSAPKYVEYLMDWVEIQLDDEAIFPQKIGAPFPPNFLEVIRTILKRLFRVYAHIYHSHFHMVVKLKEEAHLSTCFKHFVLFTSFDCSYIVSGFLGMLPSVHASNQKFRVLHSQLPPPPPDSVGKGISQLFHPLRVHRACGQDQQQQQHHGSGLVERVEEHLKNVAMLADKLGWRLPGGRQPLLQCRSRPTHCPASFSFAVAREFVDDRLEQQALLRLDDAAARLAREGRYLERRSRYLAAIAAIKDALGHLYCNDK
ncbi:hypothetical protein ABZP36_005535 [Zizania latifolia]